MLNVTPSHPVSHWQHQLPSSIIYYFLSACTWNKCMFKAAALRSCCFSDSTDTCEPFCAGNVMRVFCSELTLSGRLSNSPFVTDVKLQIIACLKLHHNIFICRCPIITVTFCNTVQVRKVSLASVKKNLAYTIFYHFIRNVPKDLFMLFMTLNIFLVRCSIWFSVGQLCSLPKITVNKKVEHPQITAYCGH